MVLQKHNARSGARRLPTRSQLLGSCENGLHNWILRRHGIRSALWRFLRSQIRPEGARTDPECWQSDATGRRHIRNVHVHRNCNKMLKVYSPTYFTCRSSVPTCVTKYEQKCVFCMTEPLTLLIKDVIPPNQRCFFLCVVGSNFRAKRMK